MRLSKGALLAAAAMIAAGPAWADDKRDFEICDGREHPGKQADGLRGLVGRPSWQFAIDGGNGSGNEVAPACTRALASPRLLPTQTLRRAHLLRARGAALLRAGEPKAALTDLDQAEIVAAPLAGDRFYQRSMGVSLALLRGLALASTGNLTEATILARTAMAARPYSLQVQQVAAAIIDAGRGAGVVGTSAWSNAVRLDPGFADVALVREAEAGNFAGVLAARAAAPALWPKERLTPFAFEMRAPDAMRLLSAAAAGLHVAYARAATGDGAGARREVADVRTHVAALRALPSAKPEKSSEATADAVIDRFIDARARQVQARIAVAEKRPADALTTLTTGPMPRDAATAELLRALKAILPADKAALIPADALVADDTLQQRSAALTAVAPEALIAPETPRAVIDYAGARPNILGALVNGALTMGLGLLGGISRTDGFRSTNNPDGTITVEFLGDTPSPSLVQEMTLLRAAEVTRAAGKPGFVIVKRADYSRRMVSTHYGVEVNSRPAGYKTELTIRYVDAGAEPSRALEAVTVIDALGPLYYAAKKSG